MGDVVRLDDYRVATPYERLAVAPWRLFAALCLFYIGYALSRPL